MDFLSVCSLHKSGAVIYISSFSMGAIGALFVSRYAKSLGLLDRPNNRSSHHHITPRGGAVGILAAFILCSLQIDVPILFWLPLSLMAGLALVGDRIEVAPGLRLFGQLLLAGILVWGYISGPSDFFVLGMVLFWTIFIVGTANFYNFMDGINGIAGLTGFIGFGMLAAFICFTGGQKQFSIITMSLSLSCLGFLPFNMPKARVFMGDVGSILLGAVFAGVVYMQSTNILDFVCMSSFLFPFYADELTTIYVRLRNGERLTRPHRRHVYQLLANEKRIPHWPVSIAYGLVQLLVGASILVLRNRGLVVVFSALIIYFAVFTLTGSLIRSSVRIRPES